MRPLRRRIPRSFGLLQDSRLWIVAALALGIASAATMVSTIHDTNRQRAVIRAIALATGERIATAAAARVEALALATFTGAETVAELADRQRQADRCHCPPPLPILAFAKWSPQSGRLD